MVPRWQGGPELASRFGAAVAKRHPKDFTRFSVERQPRPEHHELTSMLAKLRGNANWAFLHPQQRGLRQRFFERLAGHLARAEPGSLAAVMATTEQTERTAPLQQAPQWLFAFDAAGIATFRALALLAAHPAYAEQAQRELAGREG